MKFLVFSDLHLHTWKYGSTNVDGFNSRLKAQKDVLFQIANYCRDHKIEEVFFNGDLFHTHSKIDAECITVAYSGFNAISKHANITVLVGNHDMADKSGRINSVMWLEGIGEDINVVNTDSVFKINGATFHCLPYTESKYTLANFLAKTIPGSFVFLHQGVANTPMGSGFVINEILDPKMIPDRVAHVFTGHYHKHRRISDKLTIIGSTMQHTWDDSGNRCGWLVVDSETGKYKQVESEAPQFVTIDYAKGPWGGTFLGDTPIKGNFIRINNCDDESTIRQVLKEIGALSVEFGKKDNGQEYIPEIRVDGFSLAPIVKEYVSAHKVPDHGVEIGRQLQEDTYEAPQT